jgi:hypothetical protein
MMIPMTIGLLVTSVVTGRLISATGRYRIYPILGGVVAATGLLLLSRVATSSSYWFIALGMGVVGLGVGCSMQNLTLIVQNSVRREVLGTATSAQNYVRQIGASLGISVFGAMFVSRLTSQIAASAVLGSSHLATAGQGVNSLTPAILAGLPPQVRDAIAAAYSAALPPIYAWGIPVVLIGSVLAYFIQQRPMESRVRSDGERVDATAR